MSLLLSNQEIKHLINDFWYRTLRPIASYGLFCVAYVANKLYLNKFSTKCSLASLRFHITPGAIKLIAADNPKNASLYLGLTTAGKTIKEAAARSIVLQWPVVEDGQIKKGVIVITFTAVASYYLRMLDLHRFENYFNIVLEPSSAGYADPDILAFCFLKNITVVQCSEVKDRAFINCYPGKFVAASFGAGDWVNYREFRPNQVDKIYDSIYIANLHTIKRVARYIYAVRNIVSAGNANYRGCLVCASWGGDKDSILTLLEKFNLGKNIDFKFSLTKDEVVHYLNISKTNILLSYKEGSSRSLFEAMFCDVPVIGLCENIGVNKAYINEHTGLLVPDSQLEGALMWMAENGHRFKPRQWALENISPEVTTKKLASILQLRTGQSHIDVNSLFVKTNNPEVEYLHHPGMLFRDLNEALLNLFSSGGVSDEDLRDKIRELERVLAERMGN